MNVLTFHEFLLSSLIIQSTFKKKLSYKFFREADLILKEKQDYDTKHVIIKRYVSWALLCDQILCIALINYYLKSKLVNSWSMNLTN